jgi:hypothetical protein
MLLTLKDQNILKVEDLEKRALEPLILIYGKIRSIFLQANIINVDFGQVKKEMNIILNNQKAIEISKNNEQLDNDFN